MRSVSTLLLALLSLLPQQRLTLRFLSVDTSAFHIAGESSELSGTTNGSTVTPVRNAGSNGTLVITGTGSVNFAAATVGTGVQFLLGGQQNSNAAHYKFTGADLANVWNVEVGSIGFYTTSSMSWSQRQVESGNGAGPASRFAYNVYDDTNQQYLFYPFVFNDAPLKLKWNWGQNNYGTDYTTPPGTEDTLYGSGVTLKVLITWDGRNHASNGAIAHLYFNDVLVQSLIYTYTAPNWGSSSVATIGSQAFPEGYFSSDDRIDEFIITTTAPAEALPLLSLWARPARR